MQSTPNVSNQPVNGIFIKLAVVALCLSISSSVSYGLSFQEADLGYSKGVPTDLAILYSFLYGLALSQLIVLFLPSGNLSSLFSSHFLSVFLQSLILVGPIWLLLALAGSEVVEQVFSRMNWYDREEEWYQISLVLLSSSLTLLVWHYWFHGKLSSKDVASWLGKKSSSHPE